MSEGTEETTVDYQAIIDLFLNTAAEEIAGWDCFPFSASLWLVDHDGDRVELDRDDIEVVVRVMEKKTTNA